MGIAAPFSMNRQPRVKLVRDLVPCLKIVKPLLDALAGEDFKMLILPDHPTPIATATHSREPVPFLLYDSTETQVGVDSFTEANAQNTGVFVERGPMLIKMMLS